MATHIFSNDHRRAWFRGVVAAAAIAVGISGGVAAVARADQQVGRYLVKGQIEVSYFATGGTPTWGVPLIPETNAGRGGKFQTFKNQASFYWHPAADGGNAHEIGGAIRAKWGENRWENGPLGYPITDELQARGPFNAVTGAMNAFQGGVIYWSPASGAWPVWGEILVKWSSAKRESGTYGYPTGPEIRSATGTYSQTFQRGVISWP
ncbi:lysozyme [Tsukamurella sp. NPDC003166]|uniref:LGFP repeat-containing protein n=1 Tax=Tsukamurella sp. NPDC003166 TaxID=3154444 RepID=UPI0033B664F2